MNKKTINMDDIIRFSEGYEDDEFMDEESLEEEFIGRNSFSDSRVNDSRVNFEEENFTDNSFYGESPCKDDYSEELIFDLGTLEEDDEFEYHEEHYQEHHQEHHEEHHKKRCSDNDNGYNTARAYYTECNYSCGCGGEEPSYVEEDCEEKQNDYEECKSEDDGCQKAYDEGYANGYTAGYERAKQEVIDYINKRKKKNKCCRKCCCKCCCRNN